jgi:hypothetical protein
MVISTVAIWPGEKKRPTVPGAESICQAEDKVIDRVVIRTIITVTRTLITIATGMTVAGGIALQMK